MVAYKWPSYRVSTGLYFAPGEVDNARDITISRTVIASDGCEVSYRGVLDAMGLPAYDDRVTHAFRGLVQGLLDADHPVIFTDPEYLVEEYRDWFSQEVKALNVRRSSTSAT